jgi:hypothetical protein
MTSPDTTAILNRLLILNHRSLAMYLSYAPPWNGFGREEARLVLERIAGNQRAMVDRLGRVILDDGGAINYGEFPMFFTGYHDVSFEFLLGVLIERQKKEVQLIERYVEMLRLSPMSQALAQEALGESKAHFDMLEDLKKEAVAPTTVV